MDTSRIEDLLEQLLVKQDELISCIQSLEATVEQELTEANSGISELFFTRSGMRDFRECDFGSYSTWGTCPSLPGAVKDDSLNLFGSRAAGAAQRTL